MAVHCLLLQNLKDVDHVSIQVGNNSQCNRNYQRMLEYQCTLMINIELKARTGIIHL